MDDELVLCGIKLNTLENSGDVTKILYGLASSSIAVDNRDGMFHLIAMYKDPVVFVQEMFPFLGKGDSLYIQKDLEDE